MREFDFLVISSGAKFIGSTHNAAFRQSILFGFFSVTANLVNIFSLNENHVNRCAQLVTFTEEIIQKTCHVFTLGDNCAVSFCSYERLRKIGSSKTNMN